MNILTFPQQAELRDCAQRQLNLRRIREKHVSRNIFGELAWEALLLLYIAEGVEAVTITELVDRLGTSPATLLRWLEYLRSEDLVSADSNDGAQNDAPLSLTPIGRSVMDRCLRDILQTEQPK